MGFYIERRPHNITPDEFFRAMHSNSGFDTLVSTTTDPEPFTPLEDFFEGLFGERQERPIVARSHVTEYSSVLRDRETGRLTAFASRIITWTDAPERWAYSQEFWTGRGSGRSAAISGSDR